MTEPVLADSTAAKLARVAFTISSKGIRDGPPAATASTNAAISARNPPSSVPYPPTPEYVRCGSRLAPALRRARGPP